MVDHVAGKDKKTNNTPEVKTPAEKYLEEKRNAALGIAPSNQFGIGNSMAGRQGFAGKTGGGRPTIRKHAARSR